MTAWKVETQQQRISSGNSKRRNEKKSWNANSRSSSVMCRLKRHEAIFSQLLVSIRNLIDSWWRVDRIRASPREGRLLRIEPGTIVTINGEMLEITERIIRDTPRGT